MDITAYGNIAADGDISSSANITADSDITAGGNISATGALSAGDAAQTRSNLGALSSAPNTVSSGSTLADYADNLQNFVFTMPTYDVCFIMTYCAASGIGPMTYGSTYAGYLCRLSTDGYFFAGLLTNNMGHTINIHRNGSGSNVTIATV